VYHPEQRFQWWDTDRSKIGELYHRRLSLIGVFLWWKTRYPNCCITAMGTYCKKGGHHRRQACTIDIRMTVLLQGYIFWMGRLDIWYTSSFLLLTPLSFISPHVLLLVYHSVTGLFPLLTTHPLVYIPFSLSTLNLLLLAIYHLLWLKFLSKDKRT